MKPDKNNLYHSYCYISCENRFLCQCPADCLLKIISLLPELSLNIWMFSLLFLFRRWCIRIDDAIESVSLTVWNWEGSCTNDIGWPYFQRPPVNQRFSTLLWDTAGNTPWHCYLFQFHLERQETGFLNSAPTSSWGFQRASFAVFPSFSFTSPWRATANALRPSSEQGL